ncbi:hypothetical protein AAMO2058_000455000 [Amorphochlora amoebiformis]|uniref:Uncharacterized protein n=1 Tax=Amorphochlora amoebiformis TaxID=1561963 RepID=A0A7S0GPL1_9EUKA|mmetsp:Transcript_15622/g.24730  ORF Transcript_15622/g.24730 Transcript_15622/m.24730 type:complete len:482 (+) Transcript_15622:79-1524(+)
MKSDDGDKSGIDYWFYQPNHKHVVELARPRHRETGVGGTYAQASSSTGEGLGEDGVQFLGISSPMRITAIPSNTVVGSGSSGTSRSVESSRAEAKTADASKTAADSNWRRRTDGLFAQPKNIKRSSRLNSDPSEIVPPSPASQPISDILPDSKRIFRKDKCNNLLLVSTPIIGVRSPNIFDSPVLVSNENFDKMRQAVCEGDLQALRGFKPSKLEANYADRDGNCLLILASYYGHASCIMGLVEMQADVNQSNKSGSSPIICAADMGHLACLELLMRKGASISTPDNSGMTPLMWATEKGNLACVKRLVSAKANVDKTDHQGFSSLQLASTKGHLSILAHLIQKRADVNASNKGGATALMLACYGGHTTCVQRLLESKADTTMTAYGSDATHCASQKGFRECMRLLVKAGASLNRRNKTGCTAAMLAACYGHLGCLQLLVQSKANITIQDNYGRTALTWATYKQHDNCSSYLKSVLGDSKK